MNKEIYKKILFVGPEYKNHRGGIGFLISIYKNSILDFNFIPTHNPNKNKLGLILFFFRQISIFFYKIILEKEIKIIHIHGSHKGSFFRKFIIFVIAKSFSKKVIYHLNSSNFIDFFDQSNFIIKIAIEKMLHNSDKVIVVSNILKDEYYRKFRISNLESLNNMVLPIKSSSLKKKNIKVIKFLFLGRIGDNDRKGAFLLLETIKSIKQKLNNVEFLFGGDGETKKFQEKIDELELGNIVKYLGWISESEKESTFNEIDIFILPTFYEAQPLAILEAMNFSKPIISTLVASIPEVVEHEKNGILIKAGDKNALKNAILYFINNPKEIELMGLESKKNIKRFYPESVLEKLEEIYLELLN